MDETYWANGALNQISGLAGLPTLTYAPDGEGRANTVAASSGQNPISGTTYNVASEATQLNLGSGDNDQFQFDPNTFRMTQYKYTVGATPQSVVGGLTWNANGTLQKLNITDAFNAANTQTCNYSYDDLARIASGNCGSVWSQTFSYDAFGNITKAGTNSFNPGYNTATNRMSTGASYDGNGDVLTDSLHSYAWDVETRPTTIDTVTVTYDALSRMVEQTQSGTSTEIVYDALGNKLALMNGTSTLKQAFVPLPAGATAVYTSTSLGTTNKVGYYRHPDWLGSSRFSSTPSRTMYNDLAFAPFGEQYAAAGTTGVGNVSFAGNNQDTTTNLYDAYFREYGIQGRWSSPDPAGTAAVDPTNPQSWNRYAYVLNNPLLFSDPLGLWCVWQDGTHDDDPADGGDTVDQCLQAGGMWDASDTVTGCNGSWSCTTSIGGNVPGCQQTEFSCNYNGTTSVVVNGSDSNGGYGTGLPDPGCAFFYQDGIFLGTSCGNGPLQNTPQSQQLGAAVTTGVQSTTPLTNPCTIAGFYVVSAAGGALMSAGQLYQGANALATSIAASYPSATDLAQSWLYRQTLGAGGSGTLFILKLGNRASNAISAGCSTTN